jgi:hypothetical protein
MSIPKIVEHKIIKLRKPDGSTQYLLTVPKEYAETLAKEGVDSLFIVFNRGLGAFPKIPGFTEKALTVFMQAHPELQRLFGECDEQSEKQNGRLNHR